MTQQIWCQDREAGQVLGRQRAPPKSVSGQPVHGENLRRLLGAETMHIEEMRVAGHGVDAKGKP